MSLHRSSLPRHGRRALVASGMAVALVALPAVAQADPVDPTAPLGDVAGALQGGAGPSDAAEPDDAAGEDDAERDPAETPDIVPPEVVAAFQQFAAQAGIPEECVTGIATGLGLVGNGLAGLPAELEELAVEVAAAIQEAIDAQDPSALPGLVEDLLNPPGDEEAPSAPVGGDIVAGLELIATTLAEDCAPAQEEEPPVVAPVGGGTPQAPAPAPAVQQPVAQPVAYPGYAPTGADTARADDASVPLAALGGGLVLVAADAAGYGMRGRAVRTRD